MEDRELWREFGAVEADAAPQYNAEDTALADGDGGMLGRVLVYASIIVVGVAMIIWKRMS